MRRIDLTRYEVEVGDKILPYFVKESIGGVLYASELKLDFKQLLDNDRLAQKIKKSDKYVLLEEEEYTRLKHAVETIKGFNKNDVEFVKRVIEAPIVEVEEK